MTKRECKVKVDEENYLGNNMWVLKHENC
jgi:hypothetical protein